jgi:alginate O-acetyltransferase complex protein AlgI
MLFNSFEFLIFFILVSFGYFALPHRFRWMLLLTASCVFYMFFIPAYLLILVFTIIIDYIAGIMIENAQGKRRKQFLWMSLAANIGVLAFFKYYNFLNDNLTAMMGFTGANNPVPYLDIILPIGLSFHTFQAMSYTIEVYRGHQKAERHFGIFSLYVLFYPQLVAGPIERPQSLLHQFHEKHTFNYDRVVSGLKLMAWGLFKKAVIADRLAPVVDVVYNDPAGHFGWAVIVATVFFAFQIYCDFSGYSDMAIGAAQVMGFTLMTNFRSPYFASSVAAFWKRWHISLSTWFRDYLYIPLGGNRVSPPRWYFNLFLTFLISGLWHGANWTFIIWGALHGTYLVAGLITGEWRNRMVGKLSSSTNRVIATLEPLSVFVMVTFAWIFFRAENLDTALLLISNTTSLSLSSMNSLLNISGIPVIVSGFAVIAFLLSVEKWKGMSSAREWITARPAFYRWAMYAGLVLAIINLGVFGGNSFIYFQF